MPRIEDVLERESRTVDLEPGDFERLLGRRERKERNRRIRAGALGVIVALAAGIFLVRQLTSDHVPANPPEPRPVPGVSGALAYEKDGYVYIAEPDGSNAVRIKGRSPACGGPSDLMPGWSPDGRYLAFLRGCPDPVEPLRSVIVLSYPDLSVVAEFPTRGGFTWSPDSTRIAVWGGPYGQTLDVYGVDGSQQASLPNPLPDGQGGYIMWMPDDSSLLLYRYAESGMVVPMKVVPLDGTDAVDLPEGLPFASPDGARVALVSDASTVVTDADGATLFEVDLPLQMNLLIDGVVWSPDGDRFAATVGPSARAQLVVVDAATGEVTQLTQARRALLRYHKLQRRIEGVVGFSPDGERILYEGWGTGYTPKALYSIDVDGSDAHVLVEWAQDGQWRPV